MSLTPEQPRLRAQIGAYRLHAKYDSRELALPARRALLARFEREVDPEGALPVAARMRRAECARKTYFKALALKDSVSRARR